MNSDAPAGGVLAPTLLATAIPAQTGRRVWVGHEFWSIDYPARSAFADALFGTDGGGGFGPPPPPPPPPRGGTPLPDAEQAPGRKPDHNRPRLRATGPRRRAVEPARRRAPA